MKQTINKDHPRNKYRDFKWQGYRNDLAKTLNSKKNSGEEGKQEALNMYSENKEFNDIITKNGLNAFSAIKIIDKGGADFVIKNISRNMEHTYSKEHTKEIIFKLIDSGRYESIDWVKENLGNLLGNVVFDEIGMKLFESNQLNNFKYFNTDKLGPLFTAKLASQLYDKGGISAITEAVYDFDYYIYDRNVGALIKKTEKKSHGQKILAKRAFGSFDTTLITKLIKDGYLEIVIDSDLGYDERAITKAFMESDKYDNYIKYDNGYVCNNCGGDKGLVKIVGILEENLSDPKFIDEIINEEISPKSPYSYLKKLLNPKSIENIKDDKSLIKFINYLYQKDKQRIDLDSSLVFLLQLFLTDSSFKEKVEWPLEFEENTFKIDSTGRKEEERDVVDDQEEKVKVKVSSKGDVFEFLEDKIIDGEVMCKKGEQIFLDYYRYIEYVAEAKHCTIEDVKKKYIPTMEEYRNKMKILNEVGYDELGYNKFYNEKIKGHLSGVWSKTIGKFRGIGEISRVWLSSDQIAFFNKNGVDGETVISPQIGCSGWLLKKD